ncbi:MAG: DUF6122 family protein [Pseudomonadota bacterium]
MIHIALHFIVPMLTALAFYRGRWHQAAGVMVATMVVDVDHLLADPVYDPERCSIGFHPLHTAPAMALYVGLLVVPLLVGSDRTGWRVLHWIGVGLVIHMALDGADCLPF